MAHALLHTLVRSCANTPGHGLIVRGGLHYMMLPACPDKKRQGMTCGASQPAQWPYEHTPQEGCLDPLSHGHTQGIFYMQNNMYM